MKGADMSGLIKRQDAIDAVSRQYRYESDRMTALQNVAVVTEQEIRAKAIEEFTEKLKYELNGNIIPDNEKFIYARKQQEQICHQNMTLKRAIKYVDYIAEQLKGGAE